MSDKKLIKHINECQEFIAELYQFLGWILTCVDDKDYPNPVARKDVLKVMNRCVRMNKKGERYFEEGDK